MFVADIFKEYEPHNTYSTKQLRVEVADEWHGDAVAPNEDARHEHLRVLVVREVVERASRQEALCEWNSNQVNQNKVAVKVGAT